MAAWTYEISLLVLKNIFHSFAVLSCEILFVVYLSLSNA